MSELSLLPLSLWVGCAALLGLALGSFAGLVVYRLPRMVLGTAQFNLSRPASHCSACGQTLKWWHNIPVVSYVLLRGRCAFCGVSIGWMHIGIELVFALIWSSSVAAYGLTPSALAWAGFFSVLLVLLLIDWQTLLLPDVLTLPLIAAGVLCAYANWIGMSGLEALIGAGLGYSVLRLTAWVFERVRGVSGMGGGDAKLMAALGAWLGPQALVWLLLTSSLLHIVLAMWMPRWLAKPNSDAVALPDDDVPESAVPFGPPLVVAALLFFLTTAAGAETTAVSYPFKVQSVQEGAVSRIVARNDGPATVSIEVHVQTDNARSDQTWPLITSVPAFSEKVLATLSPIDPSMSYQVATRFSRVFGDVASVRDETPFRLPFSNGMSYEISQAFGSTMTTHREAKLQYAVDFDMPEGSPVAAARDGVVVEVISGFTAGGADPQFADQANTVKLQHADGSLTTYAHLSPRSPRLTVGQVVRAGEVIGSSGNTGYSSGPHLHFCVSKPMVSPEGLVEMCLPVQFATGSPAQVFTPQEGMVVQANDQSPATIHQNTRRASLMAPPWAASPFTSGAADFALEGRAWWDGLVQMPLWVWLGVCFVLIFGLYWVFGRVR